MIIVVQIESAFAGDVSGIKTILGDLLAYMNKTNSTAMATLRELDIDVRDMVDGIQSALKDCNVLSFNPHLSSTIMAAQVSQVANALVDRVCPENITLLDDPDDAEGEPWPVRRTYPVYIIHDGNPECAQVATKAKEFLLENTDLNFSQIVIQSTVKQNKDAKEDYDFICNDVDCVLLLQSSNTLSKSRVLSLAHAAAATVYRWCCRTWLPQPNSTSRRLTISCRLML